MKNRIVKNFATSTSKLFVFALFVAFSFSSCTQKVYVVKKMPPGQVKKITGSKSAKPYAPGQVKKRH
jgi:hypothetical protein